MERRNMEERLARLEEDVFFMEEKLQRLDEEIRERGRQLDALERKLGALESLARQARDMALDLAGAAVKEQEIPPHYGRDKL